MDREPWNVDHGLWTVTLTFDLGSWTVDRDPRPWTVDHGPWTVLVDLGPWTVSMACCNLLLDL